MTMQFDFTGWVGVALSLWAIASVGIILWLKAEANVYRDGFMSVSKERSKLEDAIHDLERRHYGLSDKTDREWEDIVKDMMAKTIVEKPATNAKRTAATNPERSAAAVILGRGRTGDAGSGS